MGKQMKLTALLKFNLIWFNLGFKQSTIYLQKQVQPKLEHKLVQCSLLKKMSDAHNTTQTDILKKIII